jgi:hypothetical protein
VRIQVRIAVFLIAGLTVCVISPAAGAPGHAASPAACVQLDLAVLGIAPLALADQSAKGAREAAVRRPMSQRELVQVLELLSVGDAAEAPDPASQAGKAAPGPTRRPPQRLPMEAERVGMVLMDATAILTRMNLEEAINQIRGAPKPDLGMIEWGEAAMKSLDGCLSRRYSEFGGNPALAQVQQMVLANRPQLEKLIMGSAINARMPRGPNRPPSP